MSAVTDSMVRNRKALQDEADALVAAPSAATRKAEWRGKFTPAEEKRFASIRSTLDTLDKGIAELRSHEGGGGGVSSSGFSVGNEPTTYERGGQYRYFQDLCSASMPNMFTDAANAAQRLARHGHEIEVEARSNPTGTVGKVLHAVQMRMQGAEQRTALNTTVGTGGTFLPPTYLLEEYIALPRPDRVLADIVRLQPLPRGPMVIEIPKITGGTAVASQNGQNTAVQETDLTDAYITANVQTIAGQQTVSLQAIEQSSMPYDEIVFADLLRALDSQVDAQCVNGSGSSGQFQGVIGTSGVTVVTWTTASPTPVLFYPYLGQAKSAVFKSIFRAADAILMSPDRWAWIETASDVNGRPLVVPSDNGPWNAIGTVTGQMRNGPTPVAKMFGLPVFIDTAIPTDLGTGTNQDDVILLSSKDLFLWESQPVVRAMPQTAGQNLSVILQAYEYAAFMPDRLPGAIALLSGTGLTSPQF